LTRIWCVCVAESRIGRQPNAIKHATFVQLNRIKLEKGLSNSNETFPQCENSTDESDFSQSNHGAPYLEDSDNFGVTSSTLRRKSVGNKTGKKRHSRQSVSLAAIEQDGDAMHLADSSGPFISALEIKRESISPTASDIGDGSVNDSDGMCLTAVGDYIDWSQDIADSQKDLPRIGVDIGPKDVSSNICQRVGNLPQENAPGSFSSVGNPSCARYGYDVTPAPGAGVDGSGQVERQEPPGRPLRTNSVAADYESILLSLKQAYRELEPLFIRVCLFFLRGKSYHCSLVVARQWHSKLFVACLLSILW
jgi:hypothetical protein